MRNPVSEFLDSSVHQLLNSSIPSNVITGLDAQTAWCILACSSLLKRLGKIQCADQHRRFRHLIDSGIRTEPDLHSWARACFPLDARSWDESRKEADEFLDSGVSVFKWRRPDPFACPALLFGKGDLSTVRPLFAVFNSRKPRLVSPDSSWLKALRFFFSTLPPEQIALAGSTGTPTYDLAATLALRRRLPQLLVAPFPLLEADGKLPKIYGESARGVPVLSCMLQKCSGAAACTRKRAPVCRDRILASLADLHLVLEIRSGGNLMGILEEIQAKSPRPQVIFEPDAPNSSNAGNYALLAKFSDHARGFKLPSIPEPGDSLPGARSAQQGKRAGMRFRRPAHADAPGYGSLHSGNPDEKEQRGAMIIRSGGRGRFRSGRPCGQAVSVSGRLPAGLPAWSGCLFHYTRACAGPWPGQTYRQYLDDLLDGHPLSAHSALETLVRIIQERRIRAGCRIIRGRAPVISWSSRPPQELFLMRKWNRALVRWTVEPYGIAVRRDVLRSLGAKPAVYGTERVYSRLAESERYRFQLSGSAPSASWRDEREWRLKEDLPLGKIGPNEGFVFVRTEEEMARLSSHVKPDLPVVVLDGTDG